MADVFPLTHPTSFFFPPSQWQIMIHWFNFILVWTVSLTITSVTATATEFFVSPQGNDSNPGTRQQPFATCAAARDAIRQLCSDVDTPETAVVVTIAGGTYELTEPLALSAKDSGTEKAPVIYRGAPGEKVRLAGARSITGFKQVTDTAVVVRLDTTAQSHVVVADLSDTAVEDLGTVAGKNTRFELFFENKPMQLARWPNEGFTRITDVVGSTAFKSHGIPGTKEGWFTYQDERAARWVDEPDVWLHGYWFWDWSDAFAQVDSIDTSSKTIRLRTPYHHYGYRRNQRYYALNILSELDEPGEWYLDRSNRRLYFWPPGPIEENSVTVSVLPHLLQLSECQHVEFHNLVFEGTRSTAVEMRDCRHCVMDSCRIRNCGSWGVNVRGGSDCMVRYCEIFNPGEGGIILSGGDRATLEPAHHMSLSNHIHHFGRLYRTYRPAVSVQGVGNRVAHNLIHDGPHNAIQLGGNEHLIEFNEIHDVCFETGDVGAFYMGRDWTQRGTVIRHNYFHDIQGPGLHGAMSVYLDDAASGIAIEGNIFLRAGRAAFIGGGRDNLVENNIFVDCNPSVHVDSRGIGWMHETIKGLMPERLEAMPYRESPWKERYPQLLTLLEDEPGVPKYNIIRRNLSMGTQWSAVDANAKPFVTFSNNLTDGDLGFVGDPRSPDATVLDFRLRDDSPALKSGFEPIPVEKIGLMK